MDTTFGGFEADSAPAIFGGTANPALATAVARELGTALAPCTVSRYPDGELTVRLEAPVRGREVFVVQPTSPPVNENLVELLAFADACRRASASRVTAIVPYFGYARADRRDGRREPITASLVADIMQCAGIAHVVMVDVHAPQTEGFFRVPVDTLSAVAALAEAITGHLPADVVVVSPDAGRVAMATEYADRLGAPLALLQKHRESAKETHVTHLAGDVRGRACLLIDDMISTGGTIVESARALVAAGARPELFVAATHALMLGEACSRMALEGVRQIFHTDSVTPARECDVPQETVSVAPLLAAWIRHEAGSAAFPAIAITSA